MSIELREKIDRHLTYLQQDDNNIKLLADTADLYIQLGEFDQATALVEKGLLLDPLHSLLLFHQANIALSTGHPEEALTLLDSLLASGVDNTSVRYNYAYASLCCLKIEEAKTVLQSVIDGEYADIPQADVLMARIDHHLGNVKEAMERVHTFIESHPEHAEANGVLALLELDVEQFKKAAVCAEKALQGDANNHEALVTLGTVALDDQDAPQAHHYFDRAITRFSNSGRAWIGRGLALMLQGQLADGEEALSTGLTYMPEHIGSWHALAWCQISQQKIEQAKQSFMIAMDIDRNFGETHGGLAVIAVMQNQTEEARLHIRRALGLNPNAFSANFANSLLLAKEGKAELAGSIIQKLLTTPLGADGRTLQQTLTKFIAKQKQKNDLH